MKISLTTVTTFAASVAVGCGAAVAIASSAAVLQAGPSLRSMPVAAPLVVRLEPIVVTVSKAGYEAMRDQPTVLASAAAAD